MLCGVINATTGSMRRAGLLQGRFTLCDCAERGGRNSEIRDRIGQTAIDDSATTYCFLSGPLPGTAKCSAALSTRPPARCDGRDYCRDDSRFAIALSAEVGTRRSEIG